MIGLIVDGESLDMNPGTKITVKHVSPFFADIIGYTSHSFSFNLPNSPTNDRMLNRTASTQKKSYVTIINATLVDDGQVIFNGAIKVNTAGYSAGYSVSFAVEESALALALKEKSMQSYDYEGPRIISTEINPADSNDDVIAHMNASTAGSLDYVFYPVRNSKCHPDDWKTTLDLPLDWMNYYYAGSFNIMERYFTSTGSGTLSNYNLTPFPYLLYIIRHIVEAEGFRIKEGSFSSDTEIQTLTIWNNYSIEEGFGYNSKKEIDLSKHLPDISPASFLKELRTCFGLGLIVRDKKLILYPVRDIVTDTNQVDWREYMLKPVVNNHDEFIPGYVFSTDLDADDELHQKPYLENAAPENVAGTVADFASLPAATDSADIYYVTNENAYYIDLGGWTFKSFRLFPVKIGNEKREDVVSAISPAQHYLYNDTITIGELNGRTPWVEQSTSWAGTINPFAARLLFYRGMVAGNNGYGNYPQASADDDAGNYNYSLYWEGDRGLYKVWHKDFFDLLIKGTPVSFRAVLPIAALRNIQWETRHRIRTEDGESNVLLQEVQVEWGAGSDVVALIKAIKI